MAERELLFSVTKDDFTFEAFRSSGPGGQHRNKTSTAVRCRHKASGAVGQAADSKSQAQNKVEAFKRCVATAKFQQWLRMETLRRNGALAVAEANVQKAVDRAMRPENLTIEVGVNGEWVPEPQS